MRLERQHNTDSKMIFITLGNLASKLGQGLTIIKNVAIFNVQKSLHWTWRFYLGNNNCSQYDRCYFRCFLYGVYLILTSTQWGDYFSHFSDEKVEFQKVIYLRSYSWHRGQPRFQLNQPVSLGSSLSYCASKSSALITGYLLILKLQQISLLWWTW